MSSLNQSRTAVVIEDDDDVRDLLHAVLTRSGFLVHTAPAGLAGVALVRQLAPDIVTLDVGLPDIDGFEVAQRIRRFSSAFILMVTARTSDADEERGRAVGADGYIRKPFRPADLREQLRAVPERMVQGRTP